MSFRRKMTMQRGAALAVPLLGGLAAACAGEYPQSIFRPVTDFAVMLNELFSTVFWWTMLVLVVVEAVLLFVVLRYRYRPGQPKPRQVHGNATAEILWTIGPAIIVVFIAVPTIRMVFETYRPAPEGGLIVEAIGHQWWWEFRYPEYEIATANQLHLPVGRPIEIRLRSADVLHNFWVPRLGGKRYNYPSATGRTGTEGAPYNILTFTIDEPGAYSGQCAEFCGISHAIMRMRVVADEPAGFDAWVERMRTPVEPEPGSLAEQGRDIFLRSACIACHAVQGTTAQGVLGPNLTRFGERWSIGAGLVENTPENLARWIAHPQAMKPGVLMPGATEPAAGLPPTGLSEEEIRAVAAYLSSLR